MAIHYKILQYFGPGHLVSPCPPSPLLYAAKFTSQCKFHSLFFHFLPLDHKVNNRSGPGWDVSVLHFQS